MKESLCALDTGTSPELAEVRTLLADVPACAASELDPTQPLLSVLEAVYAGRATQTAAYVEYVWEFIDGFWVKRCIYRSTFEIDFGARGTVLVKARGTMPTPES
jgi:hypothetical protein